MESYNIIYSAEALLPNGLIQLQCQVQNSH